MMVRIERTPNKQAGVSGAGVAGLIGGLFLATALWKVLLGPDPVADWMPVAAAVVAWLATRVVHEVVHWMVHRVHGRRARVSLGWPAYCWAEGRMSRNQAMLVLVAPFGLITALSLAVLAFGWARTPFVELCWLLAGSWNALGSMQDLWEVGLLLSAPPSAKVEDFRHEMRIFLDPTEEADRKE